MKLNCALKHESYKHAYIWMNMQGSREKYETALLAEKTITVHSGKNDFAAFQLLLAADAAVSVTVGDETYFSARDTRDNVRVAVEGVPFAVTLSHIGALADDDGIRKADVLQNNATREFAAHEICCIWLEAAIDETVEAGVYSGKVKLYTHHMFGAETLAEELSFTICVHDVTLPKAESRSFYLDLWQHNSNIARKHDTPLYSDAHFAVLENYVKSLGKLGQKAITVVVSEIPWSGQRCFMDPQADDDLFEYSMVRVRRDQAGVYHYDYSAMQRYIDLCFQYGIKEEIEVFGLCNIWVCDEADYLYQPGDYPEYIRVRYYDEANGTYGYISDAEGIRTYISALEQYFTEKGYLDIVRIAADEPADLERYEKSLAALQAAAPRFKYKTAVNHREFIEKFQDQVSDFVPGLFCIAQDYDLLHKMAVEKTHRVCFYVCCGPIVPNTFLCSHLLEARAMGYLTSFLGFSGFMRWSYTVWPDDPRADLRYRYPDWRCGDTCYVYPAHNGDLLLSIRYKALLRGILDFELLQMAQARSGAALVAEILQKLIKVENPQALAPLDKKEADEIISLEAADYDWAREKLLTFLEK